MLKYVAYVNMESGRVARSVLPQHGTPAHGTIVDDGKNKAIWITTENMPEGCEDMSYLSQQHWYDLVSDEWVHVGVRPNSHAYWDKDIPGWNWDRELLLNDIRKQRNILLAQSDWTQLPDAPISEEEKQSWSQYRQTLRDLIDNLGDPSCITDVDWPTLS